MRLREKCAFEVIMPDGHRYRIFYSGRVEGFGDQHTIINHLPSMIAAAMVTTTGKISEIVCESADDTFPPAAMR